MGDQQQTDEQWMREALALARHAAAIGEVPVGAVLVDENNQQIAGGWNQSIAASDPTAHAEIQALRAGAQVLQNYRLPNTTLYVTIEPCGMCVGAMIHARIKRLVFAAAEPKAGAVVSKTQMLAQAHNNHHIEVTQGILEAEASRLISDFFAARRAAKKAHDNQA